MPFDGETYDPTLDRGRLTKQLDRVRVCLDGGLWYTLDELSYSAKAPEASVSARLRDLRKVKFGGWTIERRRREAGLWEYRMLSPEPLGQRSLF